MIIIIFVWWKAIWTMWRSKLQKWIDDDNGDDNDDDDNNDDNECE